jgi:hypothetical protein
MNARTSGKIKLKSKLYEELHSENAGQLMILVLYHINIKF